MNTTTHTATIAGQTITGRGWVQLYCTCGRKVHTLPTVNGDKVAHTSGKAIIGPVSA